MLCRVCGVALDLESSRFAMALGVVSCDPCRKAPPEFDRAVAYAEYADEVREMLHLLKYDGIRALAEAPLGGWMAASMLQLESEAARECLVVAVPLFRTRRRERGFNHSELLAHAAVKRLRKLRPEWALCEVHGVLRRRKNTVEQFLLTRKGRRRNLQAAFELTDGDAIRGREVILVDDILTSGATARECARVLKRAGAARVWVATLARAQAERGVPGEPASSDVAMWTMTAEGAQGNFQTVNGV
jgi:ComF family protein